MEMQKTPASVNNTPLKKVIKLRDSLIFFNLFPDTFLNASFLWFLLYNFIRKVSFALVMFLTYVTLSFRYVVDKNDFLKSVGAEKLKYFPQELY